MDSCSLLVSIFSWDKVGKIAMTRYGGRSSKNTLFTGDADKEAGVGWVKFIRVSIYMRFVSFYLLIHNTFFLDWFSFPMGKMAVLYSWRYPRYGIYWIFIVF